MKLFKLANIDQSFIKTKKGNIKLETTKKKKKKKILKNNKTLIWLKLNIFISNIVSLK